MNFRRLNFFLAVLLLSLLVLWLLTSYRLVPRTVSKSSQQSSQNSAPPTSDNAAPPGIWRAAIKLSVTNLDIPAVQFAIFSEDPIELLSRDRKRVPFGDPAAMWDLLFRKITGDEVYLLSASPNASAGLGANTPAGKKWLVTKVARQGEQAYCWSVPFEAAPGKDVSIELSSRNAIDPAKLSENLSTDGQLGRGH